MKNDQQHIQCSSEKGEKCGLSKINICISVKDEHFVNQQLTCTNNYQQIGSLVCSDSGYFRTPDFGFSIKIPIGLHIQNPQIVKLMSSQYKCYYCALKSWYSFVCTMCKIKALASPSIKSYKQKTCNTYIYTTNTITLEYIQNLVHFITLSRVYLK